MRTATLSHQIIVAITRRAPAKDGRLSHLTSVAVAAGQLQSPALPVPPTSYWATADTGYSSSSDHPLFNGSFGVGANARSTPRFPP